MNDAALIVFEPARRYNGRQYDSPNHPPKEEKTNERVSTAEVICLKKRIWVGSTNIYAGQNRRDIINEERNISSAFMDWAEQLKVKIISLINSELESRKSHVSLDVIESQARQCAVNIVAAAGVSVPSPTIGESPSWAVRIADQVESSPIPLMPEHRELERMGLLYKQRRLAALSEGRDYSIIDHLRVVWGEWIKAGALTRPELRRRDLTAYNALAAWSAKPGNDLESALGNDIPTKAMLIDRLADQVGRPDAQALRLEWAMHKREKRGVSRHINKL
jgi:hypothetical protein